MAAARLHHPGVRRTGVAVLLPAHAVLEVVGLPGRRQVFRHPVGDDVIAGLVRRRGLNQLHPPGAPLALRLDPRARPQLVARFEVLVMAEVAVALHQAEAPRAGGGEGAEQRPPRVDEGPPQPLAAAGMQRETIGIVHLGAIVLALRALVLAEGEHAGERRDAELAELLAQVEPGFHLEHRLLARLQDEAVGAARAPRVEQRVNGQLLGARRRPFDPELGKARELLAGRRNWVDRQAARRQPVELRLAQGAQIARAEEHQHLVLEARRVERVMHAKAGEAEVAQLRRIDLVRAVFERLGIELDLAHLVVDDLADLHRLVVEPARMEEGHLERQPGAVPQEAVAAEADIAVLVVADALQLAGKRAARAAEGRGGELFRPRVDVLEAEGARLARREKWQR